MRGLFITFEGIDGCGKTSQVRALADRLRGRALDPVETREPGGTVAGNAIREILFREMSPPLAPEAELHLFAAARAQHVRELILPALEAGRIVLCDRYTDATVAYQGHGRRLDLELIREINRLATGGLAPDLTIILDLPVGDALARISDRDGCAEDAANRFDLESVQFHERVRAAYLSMAAEEPARFRVVEGAGSREEVSSRVDAAVTPVIQAWQSRDS